MRSRHVFGRDAEQSERKRNVHLLRANNLDRDFVHVAFCRDIAERIREMARDQVSCLFAIKHSHYSQLFNYNLMVVSLIKIYCENLVLGSLFGTRSSF